MAISVVTVVCIIALFVSAFLAPDLYVPKWKTEGRLNEATQKVRQLEDQILKNQNIIQSSWDEREKPAAEIARLRIAQYKQFLPRLQSCVEDETANLAVWKENDFHYALIRVVTIPTIGVFIFGGCILYVFHRLRKGNTRGLAALGGVFAVSMFLLPMLLQYLILSWWTGKSRTASAAKKIP